jgi:hypothetical protein
VVLVDVQVALRLDGDVDARMAGKQVQHVIEEPDPGRNLRPALPVKVDLHLDVGLLGLPLHGACAHSQSFGKSLKSLKSRAFYQGFRGGATGSCGSLKER